HGATGVYGDFARKLVHHSHQKVSSVFLGWLGGGGSFPHFPELIGRVIEPGSPSSQPGIRTVLLQRELGLLPASYQGILGAGDDRNIGSSNEFEHAQSMRNLRFEPLIASHDSDAQDFRRWRLDQQQD